MTDEEKEELKRLFDDGYKYLARDESGLLYAYDKKPEKQFYFDGSFDEWLGGCSLEEINEGYFTSIFWEIEEPTLIKDLMESEQ